MTSILRLWTIKFCRNGGSTPTLKSWHQLNGELKVYKVELFALKQVQSTLVISKSKGPSKTVRDIRTSTYQICSIEEKTI